MKVSRRGRRFGFFWKRTHVHLWFAVRGYGIHVKRRRSDGLWRHIRLRLAEPPRQPIGRGCLTWELDSWVSITCVKASKSGSRDRVGLKTFIRLKIGLGGSLDTEKTPSARGRRALRRLQARAAMAAAEE